MVKSLDIACLHVCIFMCFPSYLYKLHRLMCFAVKSVEVHKHKYCSWLFAHVYVSMFGSTYFFSTKIPLG